MEGNRSEYGLPISSELSSLLMAFSSIQIIVGSISNLLVIFTILTSMEMRQRSEDQLILNLAVTDFFSLSFLCFHVNVLSQGGLGRSYWSLYKSFCSTVLFQGQNAIFTIAIDRFVAVVYPMRHRMIMKRRNICILTAFLWASSLALGATIYVGFNSREFRYVLTISSAVIVGTLYLLVTAVVYAIVFYCTLKQIGKTSKQRRSIGVKYKGYGHSRHLWKITLNTFALVCLFYATYIPIGVFMVYFYLYQRRQWEDLWNERAWTFAFVFINSCLNPFAYSMRTKRFRKAFNRKIWSLSY